MQDNTSICIYHNGNSKILEFYKEKFQHLTFVGNLSESTQFDPSGCLWEVCFADATKENLTAACKQGIRIVRHISSYKDDCDNLLPESRLFDFDDWLNYVVITNLSFADEVVCDELLPTSVNNEIAIITTGRTANTHFVEVLKSFNQCSFEYFKKIDERFLQAASAILMWRLDQWECLTSIWISKQTDHWSHQLENQSKLQFDLLVDPIDQTWIKTDWVNICTSVLDHALFYKYVIGRPVSLITTEQAIEKYQSVQKKIDYDKKEIIKNYKESQSKYSESSIAKLLDLLYNKVQSHIPLWKEPTGIK
jgi:hypothetical protein